MSGTRPLLEVDGVYKGVFVARPRLHLLARDGLMFVEQSSALTALFSIREHLQAYVTAFGIGPEWGQLVERGLLEISDQVVWMVAGTTHALGTPVKAASHAQFRREYLGPRAEI